MKNKFMKNILILILSCFSLTICNAQRVMSSTYVTHIQDEKSFKVGEAHLNESVIINGEHIAGNFYLYNEWLPGTIALKDGRVYNNYKLKFDVNNQALYFLNGNDSLEVSDEVKEFVLTSSNKDLHFINLAALKKNKKDDFYEIILDENKGDLLKSYKKVVSSNDQSLANISSLKYLSIKNDFFYLNKESGKVIPIKPSGSNIKEILNLPADQKINLSDYDFSKETDVTIFFKLYLK